jgi:hypothetical protein
MLLLFLSGEREKKCGGLGNRRKKSGNALDDNADTAQWRSSWLIR